MGGGGVGGYESSGDGRLEAARYLFRPGAETPSEITLGGGITDKEDTNIVDNAIGESS